MTLWRSFVEPRAVRFDFSAVAVFEVDSGEVSLFFSFFLT